MRALNEYASVRVAGRDKIEVQMRLDGTPQGEPVVLSGGEARHLARELEQKIDEARR